MLAIILVATLTGCSAPSTFNATLRIDPVETAHTVRPELFGTNLQWEFGGDDLVRADGYEILWNDRAVELAGNAGITSLRFPGGALANTYRWPDGVGALAERKPGITFGGTPAPSLFGTDELLELASRLETNVVMTVNISAPVSEAQRWVRYINHMHDRQHDGKPMARYWEIGNEIYAPNEPGHTTALDYAQQANQFASEMKGIDPDIQIGATLEVSFLQAAWMNSVYPHMTTWNDDVLAALSDDVDFVSVHFYAPFDKLWSSARLGQLVLAGPIVFSQNLKRLQESLQQHDRNDMPIAVTEYNTFFGDKVKLDERTAEPEAALFQGLMLFEMMRNPNVVLANNWSLINNSVFGMIQTDQTGQVTARPVYPVFQALAHQANNLLLSSTVTSAGYSVSPAGNIPQFDNVPYIDAIVTKNPSTGQLIINVINRSLDSSSMLTITGLLDESRTAEVISYSGARAHQWRLPVKSQSRSGETIRIPPFSFTQIIKGPSSF